MLRDEVSLCRAERIRPPRDRRRSEWSRLMPCVRINLNDQNGNSEKGSPTQEQLMPVAPVRSLRSRGGRMRPPYTRRARFVLPLRVAATDLTDRSVHEMKSRPP